MPRVKKMSGGAFMDELKNVGVEVKVRKGKGVGKKLLKGAKFLGKELYDIAAPAVKEVAREMVKQKLQEYTAPAGKGLYAAMKGRGMRMKMSAAQVRTLKKGGAIQLKPGMFDELGRYAMEFKPQIMSMVEKALAKNKGMRVSMEDLENVMDMKKGKGIEGLLRDTGKYLQPVADAAQDRAMKELRGNGIENLLRDTGKYLQPVADAAQDRAIKEIKGRGRKKKGAGPFDFITNAIERSGVPSKLVRKGLPIAVGSLGGIVGTTVGGPVGGVAGSAAGKVAGDKLGSYLGDKYGYGLYAGMGMKGRTPYMGGVGDVIQTGAPYISHASPAYKPFKEKYNPFT